jgi:hypothetical protein
MKEENMKENDFPHENALSFYHSLSPNFLTKIEKQWKQQAQTSQCNEHTEFFHRLS